MTNDLLPCQCGKAAFVRYGKTDTGTRKIQTSCVACICGMNTGYHEHKTREAFTIWNTRTPNKSAEVDLDAIGLAYKDMFERWPTEPRVVMSKHDPRLGVKAPDDTLSVTMDRATYETIKAALSGHLATGKGADDLTKCPKCNGPADNGHDRCFPPTPYYCSKCEEQPEEPCGDGLPFDPADVVIQPYEEMTREELIACCYAHDAHHAEHHAREEQPAAPTQIDAGELEGDWHLFRTSIGYHYPQQSGRYIVRMTDGSEIQSQFDGRFFRRVDDAKSWNEIIGAYEIVSFKAARAHLSKLSGGV